MKTSSNSLNRPGSGIFYAVLLLAGSTANILLSPKWAMPLFAWMAPACMLFFYRHANIRFKVLWFLFASLIAQMIAAYDVAPFPLPFLAIVCMVNTLETWLVFVADKWVSRKSSHFVTTLIFPAVFVTKEYLDMRLSGGAWWSIANSQYGFTWLTQLASVTGLPGISFLIYWSASVAAWCISRYINKKEFVSGAFAYGLVFLAVIGFGYVRLNSNAPGPESKVTIAGVSVPTISMLENCYKDVYHQDVSIDLKTPLVSRKFQQVNTALVPFIEDPDPVKFKNAFNALNKINDSLFTLSQEAADNGAKIIVWSEANAIMPTAMQENFIRRGEMFSKKNHVFLLMAIGAFTPGKITPSKMFLENKTVFLNPDGKILNVFHKNHPVPLVEHSVPGDGKIPAIATPFGIISPSICYDADMPSGMKQLSQNKSALLLLPSGDWYDIAPYHSYMAMFRGIENGCTVVRQASGGLSLVTDYRGKIQASFDFYTPGKKLWLADVKMKFVPTIYSSIGDVFAYLCMIITFIILFLMIASHFFKKNQINFFKFRRAEGNLSV